MPTISAIHHIALTVSDLERSVAWYTEVLGLTNLASESHPDRSGHAVVLGTPDWSLCVGLHTHVTNDGEPFAEQRTGLDHLSFLVPSRAELDDCRAKLIDDPANYISQPCIALSVSPTLVDGVVEPRHVDLRPFAITGASTWVLPGGLTRVALRRGSLVVNSSQGGGSKDTWVLE